MTTVHDEYRRELEKSSNDEAMAVSDTVKIEGESFKDDRMKADLHEVHWISNFTSSMGSGA